MANTYQKNKDQRNADTRRRRTLLTVVNKAGEVHEEWKLLRKHGFPALPLDRKTRLAVDLLARRAEANCRHIVGQVIVGLVALDRGDMRGADRALETCSRLIGFDETADDVVAILIGESTREVPRGNH